MKSQKNKQVDEIEVINDICSNVANALLCQFYEDWSSSCQVLEVTNQSLQHVHIMHSELKEHYKDREKTWVQKVIELTGYCKSSENDNNEEIHHARLYENQDTRESSPNLIAKIPQLLITDAKKDQKHSDEKSISLLL